MKNGVECCKDFFPYFKALKTNCVLCLSQNSKLRSWRTNSSSVLIVRSKNSWLSNFAHNVSRIPYTLQLDLLMVKVKAKKKQEHVCNHVGILSSPRSSTLPLCILTWKWMGWLVYDTNFTALNWAPYWLPILSIFANMKAIFAHIHLSNLDTTKVCERP